MRNRLVALAPIESARMQPGIQRDTTRGLEEAYGLYNRGVI